MIGQSACTCLVVRRSMCAVAHIAARPCLAAVPVHSNAPARTSVQKSGIIRFFDLVRALGIEPRTFRVSVECSTN